LWRVPQTPFMGSYRGAG